jgi:hypothetical protein
MVAMEFEPGSKLNFRTFPAVRQERVRTARIGNIRTNALERKERQKYWNKGRGLIAKWATNNLN